MFRSLRLGKFFGVPVYLHATLLLLPAWVVFSTFRESWLTILFMNVAVAALFVCVLLHEFGHIFMARYFGIATRDVTLYPIGGAARLERMTEDPLEEVFIALAGPAVNVVIAVLLTPLVFAAFLAGLPVLERVGIGWEEPLLVWLARFVLCLWGSNLVLVVFNLVPAFPMDGGRVFRAVLASSLGYLRATEIAARVGIVVAILIAAVLMLPPSYNPMGLFIGAFVVFAGQMELAALRRREAQRLEAARPAVEPRPSEGWEPFAGPRGPLPYPDEDEAYAPREPAAAAGPAERDPNFSGYTWDREFQVWVKWQNGRRVAAQWHGSE